MDVLNKARRYLCEDIFLLRMAAIFHDVDRFEEVAGHTVRGSEIVKGWLQEHPEISN